MYLLAQNSDFISEVFRSGSIIPILVIVLGCTVAIVAIISCSAKNIAISRAREQSRRELAAYVAEGTMAPDDAVALMNSGKSGDGCCNTGKDSLIA